MWFVDVVWSFREKTKLKLKTITTVPSSTMNLFRNLALQLFSRLRKADPSYIMKFYFTSLTLLSFFLSLSLGRNASMRINKLVSKENWTKTKDCNGHQCARVEDAYFFHRFDVASKACLWFHGHILEELLKNVWQHNVLA